MADRPNQRRRSRPKYTADALIPGAFEGETVTRRRFMTGSAHTAGAVAAAAFTLPALGFAIGPVFQRAPVTWQDIGALDEFTDSNYSRRVIVLDPPSRTPGHAPAVARGADRATGTE